MLTKIIKVFAKEELLLQHCDLGKRIALYFPRHKLAIEVDEKGHTDRPKNKEEEEEKAIEKELGCEIIIINPDGNDFDICVEVGKISNHINKSNEQLTKESTEKSTKKSLLDKISKRLLELEF